LPVTVEDPEALANFMTSNEAIALNNAFRLISDPEVRANFIRLASAAAGLDEQVPVATIRGYWP
jgi:hypothetical protein